MKRTAWFVATVAGAMAASAAWAGFKSTEVVYVSTTPRSQFAWGSLGSARSSSDSVQYIGCRAWSGWSGSHAYCFARDASGRAVSCFLVTESQYRLFPSLNGDSELFFSVGPEGECSDFEVTNASDFEPKQ